MALIVTEGLTKDYRLGPHTVHALRGLTIEVERGEFVAGEGRPRPAAGTRPGRPAARGADGKPQHAHQHRDPRPPPAPDPPGHHDRPHHPRAGYRRLCEPRADVSRRPLPPRRAGLFAARCRSRAGAARGGGPGVNVWQSALIAVRALRVNKLRSALTMLGIIIGVGAVIAMVGVGAGAQASVTERIESLGTNLIVATAGSVTSTGARLGLGTQFTLTEDDAAAIAREIHAVQVVAPSLKGKGQVVFGDLNWSTDIYGVTEDYQEARDWPLDAGRPLGPEDVDGATKVALVGQTTAVNLFGDSDPLGPIIR